MDALHTLRNDIGVALIGFGYAGRTFHAPLISATPGLALRVVASSQPARVREAYPDVWIVATPEEALAEDSVDLVVVATPNDTHASLAEAALGAGRDVVVDKPFTVTFDDARRVVEAVQASGRRLAVFQNRRWDSDFLGILQAVRDDVVGEVVELRSEIARWRPEVRDRWRERPGPGSGLWYDLGPHLVDQALVLFGPPQTVQATLQVQRTGGVTPDWFHVVLGYGRRQVLLTSGMLAADPAPRFIVRGTTGSLVKRGGDVQERDLAAGGRPGDDGWGHDPDPLLVYRAGEAPRTVPVPAGEYGTFYAAMRDAMWGEGHAPVALADALVVMAIIEAGIRSSNERHTVPLDLA